MKLLIFFLFTYIIKLSQSEDFQSNEIDEAKLDEYLIYSIKGKNKLIFKVVSTCDECNWFRIEMENKFRKTDALNIYTDLAFEPVLTYPPSYTNYTNGISDISTSNSNGVRRIIFKIDYFVIPSGAIYFSFGNRDTDGKAIPDDFSLDFIVKFSNRKTKEELEPLYFYNNFYYNILHDGVHIFFNEALNDENVKQSDYYLVLMKPAEYDYHGVQSIFMSDERIIAHFIGKNNQQRIELIYEQEYVEGFILSLIVTYTYKDSNEKFMIAYDPRVGDTSKNPNTFMYSSINALNQMRSYALKRQNKNDEYYVIEFNNEMKKEGSYNGRELPITFCSGSIAKETNDTVSFLDEKFENGRTVLIVKINTPQLIITFGNEDITTETKFLFKYYTMNDTSQEHKIQFNSTIDVLRKGDTLYVKFEPLHYFNGVHYYVRLFKKELITDEYDLDSIYPNSSLIFKEEEIRYYTSEQIITQVFAIDYNDTSLFYANILSTYKYYNGNNIIEERFSYKHAEAVVKPSDVEIPKDRIYNKLSLNSTKKSVSYKIKPIYEEYSIYSIYVVEIVVLNKTLSTEFDYAYEIPKETPTLQNDTNSFTIIDAQNKSGIYKIIFKANKEYTIFSLFIKDKKENNEEMENLDMNFKYKIIYSLTEENEDPRFNNTNTLTIKYTFSSITVSFFEMFNSTSNVASTNYILTLYQQNDITNTEMINNVNLNLPIEKVYNKTIEVKNNGTMIQETFPWPENLEGKLIGRVIVYYKTKDDEEKIGLFAINKVYSNTKAVVTLIVICSVMGFAGLIGLIYYCVIRNRKKYDTMIETPYTTSMGSDGMTLNPV